MLVSARRFVWSYRWKLSLLTMCCVIASTFLTAQSSSDGRFHLILPESEQSEWFTSGVWNADETAILLADPKAKRVVELPIPSLGSKSEIQLVDASERIFMGSRSAIRNPSQIQRRGDSFFIEDDDRNEIVKLNSRLEFEQSVFSAHGSSQKTPTELFDNGGTLRELWAWVPAADGGIFGFGDLSLPDSVTGRETWVSAFVYFDDEQQIVLREVPVKSEERSHYLLATHYLAALDDGSAYALIFDVRSSDGDEPAANVDLQRVPYVAKVSLKDKKLKKLDFFPRDFETFPSLETRPGLPGAWKAYERYRILEASRRVVGLYSRGNSLHLLLKTESFGDRPADWFLGEINPENGESVESLLPLGADASSLTVVPGARKWAFLEKEAVQPEGKLRAPYRQARSFFLVDTASIE